ncbi:MAG: LacI family DNA-binding transcriptional regulator, partial [Clostridiales bacterium]
ATISRVINGSNNVSKSTKLKVERILAKFDYSPNAIARGLVVKSMNSIGVLATDIRDTYYANISYTIEQELSNFGYSMILCNTSNSYEKKVQYINKLLEKKVDGIILVGSVFIDDLDENIIQKISSKVPVILINSYIEGENIYSILCDDFMGISNCVDYLANKGFEKFAYLQDKRSYSAVQKLNGFNRGINNNLIKESLIIETETSLTGGYNGVNEIIKSNWSKYAIITGEDIVALGALKKLISLNINIPEDVAITGFNNSIISQCSAIELTTVDSNMEKLGIGAVRILKKILSGSIPDNKTVITPELIIRDST